MDRVIESARKEMASKEEVHEKDSILLQRQVSYREKEIEKLLKRLDSKILLETRLRDLKNEALRENRSATARSLLLRDQRDASVAKVKAMEVMLKDLKEENRQLIEVSKAGAAKSAKTRSKAKGRPYTDEFETHAVRCMATGISAVQRREQMLLNRKVMITACKAAQGDFEVPEIRWF